MQRPTDSREAPVSWQATIASSRGLRAVAFLLFAAGLCSAQAPDSAKVIQRGAATEHVDELFHGHGFDPTGGLHVGVPTLLSASLGPKLWLGDVIPGAVFLNGEPGILGVRYGGGYQVFEQRLYGVGAAVRFGRLVTWSNALGAVRAVRYSGTELALSWVFAFSVRAGTYAGRAQDGRRVLLGTIDLGMGF